MRRSGESDIIAAEEASHSKQNIGESFRQKDGTKTILWKRFIV